MVFVLYPLLGRLMSLQVSRSVVENMRLPTENTFERGAKFGAKDGVNDRIKCGVEPTQPQEKADQCHIEVLHPKYRHK